MIKRATILNHFIGLIILFPVIFSFIFEISGISIPSYLFVVIILLIILPFTVSNFLTISKSSLKFTFYVFFIWILSSIIYTPSVIASQDKFIYILYLIIIPVIIIEFFFLFSKTSNIEIKTLEAHLLRYSYVLIWFIFFAYLLFRTEDAGGRYSLPGIDNVIWLSRYVGMLLLIILCCDKFKKSNSILYGLSTIIGIILLLGIGSRQSFFAVLIVFLIKQSNFVSKKKMFFQTIGIVFFIAIGYLLVGGYVFETNFYSIYARLDLYNLFVDYDFDYLIGSGIGSYSLNFGKDVIFYPHNIFLELFFENGLIGVLLFCLILYFFISPLKNNIISYLVIYYFIVSLVSSDIPGNNNLFILLFLSAYVNDRYSVKSNIVKL
tara:strand:- start:142 stop:1275 length:1134 start_codon:yes stop_codon:yes gene_type:complete